MWQLILAYCYMNWLESVFLYFHACNRYLARNMYFLIHFSVKCSRNCTIDKCFLNICQELIQHLSSEFLSFLLIFRPIQFVKNFEKKNFEEAFGSRISWIFIKCSHLTLNIKNCCNCFSFCKYFYTNIWK